MVERQPQKHLDMIVETAEIKCLRHKAGIGLWAPARKRPRFMSAPG